MVTVVWRELRLLAFVAAISLTVALLVRYVLGYPIPLTSISIPDRMLRAFRYALLLGPVLIAAGLVRERLRLPAGPAVACAGVSGWRLAFAALRRDALTTRVVLAVATCLLLTLMLSVVAVWKASIPMLAPWHLDASLVRLERTLHGGVLPQDLTRRWFGPEATVFLDRMYRLWFRLLALFIVWQSFRQPSFSRSRAVLALALAYTVLGNIVALALSAGGPVYYSRLVSGPDPYAAHSAFLASVPHLRTTVTQQRIWDWLLTGHYIPFASISAMPSMHVSVATLMALACWEWDRRLGALAWAYAIVILVASVHLNWHYALDGYVAILGTLVVWRASAWLVRRYA